MKTCSKCKQAKDLSEFGKNKQKKDGLQSYCKTCSSSVALAWHHTNKHDPEVAKRLSEYNKKVVAEIKTEVDAYKAEKGCKFCPEDDPCCLDFHHLNEKDANVSYIRLTKNKKRLFEEISRCIVVCSNCHRKLHAGRLKLEEPGSLPGGTTAGSHLIS